MQARIRTTMDKRAKGDTGFTLIELLIVIVIIGILAAIAVPAFLRNREKAWIAQAQSALKNASIAAEAYSIDHNGSYAGLRATDTADSMDELVDYGFTSTEDVTVQVRLGTSGNSYSLYATHDRLGDDRNTYLYESSTGTIQDTVSGPGGIPSAPSDVE